MRSWISSTMLVLALVGCGGSAPATHAPDETASQSAEALPEPAADTAPAADGAPPAGDAGTAADGSAAAADDLPAPPAEGGPAAETRTSELIAKVVLENRKAFRDCFDQARKQDKNLKGGTLTLHFTLDPHGKVTLAELNQARSDVTLPLVVDCALTVLRGMKFPASSRGMESNVNYPFDFKN